MGINRIKIITQLLSEIEGNISNKDFKKASVSQSTIGWQLDHALKVVNGICGMMVNSNPEDYKADFNPIRIILFTLGFIPRGRGKAPKIVLPPEVITEDDLLKQLAQAKINLEAIKPLPKTSYFKHFLFGTLSKKQTIRFIEIHTKHHLKIVRDILN